ncbi:PREDICTED: uncharacterized protein LOC109231528 [Nicotiana attenuata]|uniref:uncharacterized protein LOC109231528 n=1 Tax=Nicotiana attenuata TaxID=49451 RepID=UPI000904E344|nr:PREDICTED: uncharacterized protein LOC109231528 [Nicotiana attenuata]
MEIESARRADTRAKIFLTMPAKYQRYRDKCREMHERLRANPNARSLGEELEKRDQQLMEAIRRSSVLEEKLRAKDEELELGKGVAAECEHLQVKLRSMQSEMDQNLIRVEAMSAEWMGKLTELERKVACLENIESAWSSALARTAALENTIRVLQSEQESERATTTLREARLEESIGEIDRDSSTLVDRVAALEAEKEQLLAQAEYSSAAAPRHLHELWVHAEAQRDIYKSLWEAGKVTEAAYEGARAKAREAHVNCGYDSAMPEADEGVGDEGGSPGDGVE